MLKYIKIIALTLIVTGGLYMVPTSGWCDEQSFSQYSSKDTELNLAMDYISGWKFSETRGSYGSYAQVQFYGEMKGDFAPTIVVTVKDESKLELEDMTAKAKADDIVAKRLKLADAELISMSEKEFLGLPAVDLMLAYKKKDKLKVLDFKMVPFQERVVVFKKDKKFYTLRYVNPTEEFPAFEQAFEHCINTLEFKD